MQSFASSRPAGNGASRSSLTPVPDPIDHHRLSGLRAELRRTARRLAEADVELDADTVVALLTTCDHLRAAGGVIDDLAAALLTQLRFQLADAESFSD